jgi:hypothetical protein
MIIKTLEIVNVSPVEAVPLIYEEMCHHWILAAIMAGVLTTGEYNYYANYPGNKYAPGVCCIPKLQRIRCCEYDLFDALVLLISTPKPLSTP